MKSSYYEFHNHPDPDFLFIFRKQTVKRDQYSNSHWHESIELLYCVEGKGKVRE